MTASAEQALAAELTALGYVELFLRAGSEHIDRVWDRAEGATALQKLSMDGGAAWEARFLAAEILFRKQPGFPRNDQRGALVPAYIEALKHARMGNPWGLPGELDGDVGRHLITLGEPAAVALESLLDDGHRVPYWGSKEATLGNSFAFRVKDFAAFFISAIRGWPYVLHTEPSARDEEIQKLMHPQGTV